MHAENIQLHSDIDTHKLRQNALIDELAMMISCLKEKEIEEQIEAFRLKMQNKNSDDDDDDQSLIARQFEGNQFLLFLIYNTYIPFKNKQRMK